jgi:kelch-like protein 18
VLGIQSFADTLGCSPLVLEADKYIQQYFHNVSMSDEYLNLSCQDLLSIVRKDELHVFSEEQVGGQSQINFIFTVHHCMTHTLFLYIVSG